MKNFGLFSFVLILSLLFAEWILRLTGRLPFIVNPEQKKFWRFDEDFGWAHRPNQEGMFVKNELEHHVKINSKGLRDDEYHYRNLSKTDSTQEGQMGKKRILVLGDSFAWGFGVEKEERFSEQLEQKMNVDVINAGVSGYSTDQEYLWYMKEGAQYDVDAVVLLFCGNDESDNYKSMNYIQYNKPRFEQEYSESGLKLTKEKVSRANGFVRFNYWAMQRSAFYYQFVKVYELLIVPKFEIEEKWKKRRNLDDNAALSRIIIAKLAGELRNRGDKFLVVTTKSYWQDDRAFTYAEFTQWLKEDGHNVIDVSADPAYDFDQMTLRGDQHWNSLGHEFVADLIYEQLDSLN